MKSGTDGSVATTSDQPKTARTMDAATNAHMTYAEREGLGGCPWRAGNSMSRNLIARKRKLHAKTRLVKSYTGTANLGKKTMSFLNVLQRLSTQRTSCDNTASNRVSIQWSTRVDDGKAGHLRREAAFLSNAWLTIFEKLALRLVGNEAFGSCLRKNVCLWKMCTRMTRQLCHWNLHRQHNLMMSAPTRTI